MRLAVAVMLIFVVRAGAATRTFKSAAQEIDVFAAVLRSEVAINHWSEEDRICVSVHFSSPGKDVIKRLRSRGLNVYRDSDWPRNVRCKYAVRIEHPLFIRPEEAHVEFETSDLRVINSGTVHFAEKMREGIYRVEQNNSDWHVSAFAPKSKDATNVQR